jgi:hypothetical protein
VTLTASTINLNSTSQLFSSLISNATSTETVHYNRHVLQVGPVGTNDLISASLTGQTSGSFDTTNTNLPASRVLRAFAPYDTNTGNFQNYDTTTNMSTLINADIGYRAVTTDGGLLTFTGTVRTNDILDISISDAAVCAAWNLIGTPYSSCLYFAKFFNLHADVFETNGAYQAVYG